MIIDEIQKASGLLDEIKKVIDEQRLKWMKEDAPRQLMYILTVSNRFELQQGISDSLAGRCGVIDMASFSSMEKQKLEENCFSAEISFWMKLQNSKKFRTIQEQKSLRQSFKAECRMLYQVLQSAMRSSSLM